MCRAARRCSRDAVAVARLLGAATLHAPVRSSGMGTTRLLCGLLTLGALLLPAASVAATDPFVGSSPRITRLPVPPSAHIVGDDGDHHLVFDGPGASPASFDLDLDTGAVAGIALPATDCYLANASPGWLAARCRGTQSTSWVRPLGSGDWAPVVAPDNASLIAAGQHWLQIAYDDPHNIGGYFLSRGDGHIEDADGIVDLNSPGLRVPICKPISPAGLTDYDKPWALRTTGLAAGRTTLTAQRCGSKKRRVLARDIYGYTLHGNVATWTTPRRAYVHNLRTGKTITVRIPNHRVSFLQIGDHLIARTAPLRGGDKLHLGTVRLPRSFGQ